jgi:hypothetical protein
METMGFVESIGAGWVFLAIIVLVIISVVGLVQKKQAIATKIATVLSIVFVVTVGYVYITSDIELTSLDGLFEGTKIYFKWMGSVIGNMWELSAQAVSMNWGSNVTG